MLNPNYKYEDKKIKVKIGDSWIEPNFERYDNIEPLGEPGANGVVIKGTHKITKRDDAIKIWLPRKINGKNVIREEQYIAEVQKIAKLNDPRIVTIHDAWFENGCYCCSMDFIDGITYEKWLEDNKNINTRVKMLLKIFDTIFFYQTQDIIHGDICRTLSIIMNMYNQHKRDFQPRVEVDLDSLLWVRHEYDVNETKKIEILPSGEVVNATYVTCHIETNVFTKGICNINLDKFNDYFNSTDLELNYMLDEFYLALGKEDAHSKFFHLFSIVEFIEKKYVELSEAKALLTKAEVKEIVVHVSDLKIKSDSKIMQRITDALRNSLTQMTDYGRVDKLVNILKNMGINEIICLTEKVAVDKTVVSQIIKLRNCLFHGDFDESRENTGKETQSVIEKLFIICGMIIEWVADNKKL